MSAVELLTWCALVIACLALLREVRGVMHAVARERFALANRSLARAIRRAVINGALREVK